MTPRIHPHFGANVRWYRKMRGLGVNELARKASVSPSLVSAYELGKTNPRYRSALLIAEALQIPVEYVWDHRPPPGAPPGS